MGGPNSEAGTAADFFTVGDEAHGVYMCDGQLSTQQC